MFQMLDGKPVYVVDLATMPVTPIMGLTEEEEKWERACSVARGFTNPSYDPQYPKQGVYAKILTEAIESGIIAQTGKYALHRELLANGSMQWNVFEIKE